MTGRGTLFVDSHYCAHWKIAAVLTHRKIVPSSQASSPTSNYNDNVSFVGELCTLKWLTWIFWLVGKYRLKQSQPVRLVSTKIKQEQNVCETDLIKSCHYCSVKLNKFTTRGRRFVRTCEMWPVAPRSGYYGRAYKSKRKPKSINYFWTKPKSLVYLSGQLLESLGYCSKKWQVTILDIVESACQCGPLHTFRACQTHRFKFIRDSLNQKKAHSSTEKV